MTYHSKESGINNGSTLISISCLLRYASGRAFFTLRDKAQFVCGNRPHRSQHDGECEALSQFTFG